MTQPNISRNPCPLCHTLGANVLHRDPQRSYLVCRVCNLVFVPSEYLLSPEKEKAEYDLHRNDPDDQEYRQFLNRLFSPMLKQLNPGSHGLDFGSGPGPTLSIMFEEAGHKMTVYDHFYANDPAALDENYDFITATEVVEHLHEPRKELDYLWTHLNPGGRFGIMTKLVLGPEEFKKWHYKNDLTHVCFFSESTFKWLANLWRAKLTFLGTDVIIFNKSNPAPDPKPR
ncbi:MAG: class I SAM-dependent methyltransferase [Proteobacteria bacterium]|nr:class I SAM-dependent methyltransferase [Pseudomonadota bacterium]MBU1716332.1 class I SAM-dependent methyltransferase [Pseudomonadota bacterium]